MYIYKSNLSHDSFTAQKNSYTRRYLSELTREYEELKDAKIPALTEADFAEFEETGSRLAYERKYFRRRTMLRDFGLMMWLGYNDAAAPLEKIIAAVCDEETWALPAHIGSGDKRTVIDLFAAETAQTLTEIISLCGEGLSEKLIKRVQKEVSERVLMPFINRKEKYGWESARSNWCAVCGGSVGMTALYLVEDEAGLKRVTESLIPVFESYMESFSDDGACLEGLYYWGYGMVYLIAFLELYGQRTGERFPINVAKLTKMADFAHKCCITNGITVSFSDAGERDRICSGLSHKLSAMYGSKPVDEPYLAYLLGDDCGRWCRAARDIAWTGDESKTDYESVSVLSEAQWAVMRGGKYSCAFKGGGNGEPHNHNDIGSFTAIKDGEVILCDLGAGEYTREYFSDGRYNIFCCSSNGHSVPIINGTGQSEGGEYSAADFFASGGASGAEISGAYGQNDLKKCRRTLRLNDGSIELTDELVSIAPVKITERFITRHNAAITENGVTITAGGKTAVLKTDMECKISITGHRHAEHNGKETEVTAIDYCFEADNTIVFRLTIE